MTKGLLAGVVLVIAGWWFGQPSNTLSGPDMKSFHGDVIEEHIPENASVVITFDAGWLLEQTIRENWGLFPPNSDPDDIMDELSEASKKHWGVDITEAKRAWVWIAPISMAAAVVLEGVDGELKGDSTDYEGADLVKMQEGMSGAVVDGRLILGTPEGVKRQIKVFKGKMDPLSKNDKAYAVHVAALDEVGDGSFVVSGAVGDLADLLPDEVKGLKGGAWALNPSGSMTAAVIAEEATLKRLKQGYEDATKKAEDTIAQALEEAEDDGPGVLVMGLLIAKYKLKDAMEATELVVDGEVAKAEIHGVGGFAAAYVGIAAAVAVPAFIKYMRRAKTAEAIDLLDRMYKGASVYYTTPHVERGTGKLLPCQFPESQGLTPNVKDLGCCGGRHDKDGDKRCDVDPTLWTTATWSALAFQLNDPHYFGYEFESKGTGPAAFFTARAHADLDCDGVLSTFERYGYGDKKYGAGECSMKGSSAFYKNNETE